MSTNSNRLCSECGKPLAPEALLGTCPECMMKAGLGSPAPATVRVSPDALVESPETETREFVPGTRLGYFGDYELLEEIARGGMGVVYQARQSSLKRIVAVKMIRSGGLADETEVARFRTEAQAAAQLQHPNIVAIHEIGEHEGRQYFSMDFVEGKNLAQIAGGKPVAPQKAAEWLKAIAGAVQFAHQRGVLHRDLKPQNIMVDAEGRPRVTDFGLAKNIAGDSTLTQTGAVMGSPSYMSPEQARGRNDLVGPASDVYSLGAILYELLTGRPPFRGKTPLETLSEVVNDEPRPPRSSNPNAPVDLETICLKCLEKEPVRRYPTARELELDLGRFLAGEPVQARPASGLRRLMIWSRRHRGVVNVAVPVLILTLMGLAYGLWEQTRFLTWLLAHPGFVKATGTRSAEFEWVLYREFMLFLFSFQFFKWTFGPAFRAVPTGVVLAFGALVGAGMAGTLYLAAKLIAVGIWEAPQFFGPYQLLKAIAVYFLFWWWFSTLLEIVRQQRRKPVDPGLEGQEAELTPEQLAPIRAALSAGKVRRAAKAYRAATQVPSYEARRRALEMAKMQMSADQLAAIHREIFAGRTLAAAKLYRAATRVSRISAGQSVMMMMWDLYYAHPEKFSRAAPDFLRMTVAGWTCLNLSFPLLLVLWLTIPWSLPTWLISGIVLGALGRISWSAEARSKVAVLFLYVFIGWLLLFAHYDVWKWFCSELLAYWPGLVIGCLLMQLSLKKRKVS